MICRSLNEKEASKVPVMIQASLHFSSKLCCSIVTSVHKEDRKDAVLSIMLSSELMKNFHSQTPRFSKQLTVYGSTKNGHIDVHAEINI